MRLESSDLWFGAQFTDEYLFFFKFSGAIDSLLGQTKLHHKSFELPTSQTDWIYGIPKVKSYVPLLEMDKCQSLEEKLSAPSSKRRKNTKDDS